MESRDFKYQGIQCIEVSHGALRLIITQSVGPRVLSLQVNESKNLFAELPDLTLECPGSCDFHFYGGHRPWYAPDEPAQTHLPDDLPVEIEQIRNGVRLIQDPERGTNFQKVIVVRLVEGRTSVEVNHIITNLDSHARTLAPWAITQLRPGGIAILPLSTERWKGNPTLPNRSIVLWPYTDLKNHHFEIKNDYLIVHAIMMEEKLKVGFPNPRGWIGYWRESVLFIKHADYFPDHEYFDFGSSSECYCDPNFLELETLGPKTTLQEGESVIRRFGNCRRESIGAVRLSIS